MTMADDEQLNALVADVRAVVHQVSVLVYRVQPPLSTAERQEVAYLVDGLAVLHEALAAALNTSPRPRSSTQW